MKLHGTANRLTDVHNEGKGTKEVEILHLTDGYPIIIYSY
jgi:hypothetical protein